MTPVSAAGPAAEPDAEKDDTPAAEAVDPQPVETPPLAEGTASDEARLQAVKASGYIPILQRLLCF